VLVYIQISANYMFRPLLVSPSSGWIPSPRKYLWLWCLLPTVVCIYGPGKCWGFLFWHKRGWVVS